MNPFLILGVLAGGLLLIGATRTGEALQNLTFTFSKARLKKQSGFFQNFLNTKISFDISINNPSKTSVKFTEFKADVIYNNKVISNISIEKILILPAKGNTLLKDIQANLKNIDIAKNLLNLLQGGKVAESVNIKGYIKADGFKYPVDEIIKIS